MDNLPLLELFTQLRKTGLPLEVDDYQAVLKALQAGYGIESKAALARLCRTLWVKSKQDKQLFDYHFEKIIFPNIESNQTSILVTSPTSNTEKSPNDNAQEEENKLFSISSYLNLLKYYIIPVGIFILVFGIAIKIWRSNHVPIFINKPKTQVEKGKFYKYVIKAHDVDKGDIVTIEAVRCPRWLTFKNDKNGTATLSGVEGSRVGNCEETKKPKPSWLTSKDNKNGTATLSDTEGSTVGNCEETKKPKPSWLTSKDNKNGTATLSDTEGSRVGNCEEIKKPKPSWLTSKDNKNGTATLSGTEGSTVGNYEETKKPNSYSVELRVTDNHGAMMSQNFEIKVDSDGKEISIWLLLLQDFIGFAITLTIVYVTLGRKKTGRNAVQDSLPSERENITPDNSLSEALGNISNEKKVLEAQQKTSQANTVKPLNRFIQITEYPPLTRRQMKQSWRYLRRMLREGVPTELDVEATIERISRQGLLLEPVIVPRRVNRSKLLLFIDQDGSMMPFQNLSHQLAETAIRGGRLEDTDIYYFHNCPIDYLYRDRYYQMPETIDDILNSLRFPYTSALIFSDAGAARGGLNPERREVTAQFLEQLRQQVRHIAWLNPMPRYRWFGTTAGEIARLVAMFELNRQGLHNAISVLRGQSGHFGVSKL